MIYTLTLNPALDYVMHTENVEFGKTNRSEKEDVFFGGKGINVSYVLKELGVDSVALGFVGGFTGDAFKDSLDKVGMHHDFIRLSRGLTRINVKIKTAVETEINGKGPDVNKEDYDKLLDRLSDIGSDDCLVIAGSLPGGLPADTYECIAKMMQKQGVRLVVDVSGKELKKIIRYKPFLIKPNIHEFEDYCGKPLKTAEDIYAACLDAKNEGARNILLSMGAEGAVFLDENGKYHKLSAPEIVCINSVGAGDSMLAGFLFGLSSGIEEAFKISVAAGSATAASNGLASRSKIEEMSMIIGKIN